MKNIKLLTIIATTGIAAYGFSAKILADDDAPAPARGQILQRIAEKLNLTGNQKLQIKAILREDKDTLTTLLGQLHGARKNLRTAAQAGDANETSVHAASARLAGVEADFAVERMKLYGKIMPILTDEQRQKISEFTQRADDFADGVIARIGDGLAQ
jgi:Spy/CpxP family protein refolding chaperone